VLQSAARPLHDNGDSPRQIAFFVITDINAGKCFDGAMGIIQPDLMA
jgi:hypothetical protein